MDLRSAFAYSVNTVAAKLGDEVGTASVANVARRFGISTPINTQPAMVLGSSEVRVIDMTAAFAAIARKGVSAAPYGITKVTTADGRLLYQRPPERGTVLVDSWVAAGITDLMQTAVATGTGRAAQIGRPVAGKTGTTSSNKDGWFLGFSSGLTTGVWMGRDDAKPVGGLQGGRAPAKAFADFMRVAVAGRPVEAFDTEVKLPDWQLEEEDDAYFGEPGEEGLTDENGMPIELPYDSRPCGRSRGRAAAGCARQRPGTRPALDRRTDRPLRAAAQGPAPREQGDAARGEEFDGAGPAAGWAGAE